MSTVNTWISSKELSKLIGVSVRTLATWRTQGKGPKYCQVFAHKVRYLVSDVNEWMESIRTNHAN